MLSSERQSARMSKNTKDNLTRSGTSDVVLETKVLVSRRLEDKNTSLGLGRLPRRAGRAAAAVILGTPPPPNYSCRRAAAAAAADNNAA